MEKNTTLSPIPLVKDDSNEAYLTNHLIYDNVELTDFGERYVAISMALMAKLRYSINTNFHMTCMTFQNALKLFRIAIHRSKISHVNSNSNFLYTFTVAKTKILAPEPETGKENQPGGSTRLGPWAPIVQSADGTVRQQLTIRILATRTWN